MKCVVPKGNTRWFGETDFLLHSHFCFKNENCLEKFFVSVWIFRTPHKRVGESVRYLSRTCLQDNFLLHTFSAFWLRSSVVSVLLSLISEMSPLVAIDFQEYFWERTRRDSLVLILSRWCSGFGQCRRHDSGIAVLPGVVSSFCFDCVGSHQPLMFLFNMTQRLSLIHIWRCRRRG